MDYVETEKMKKRGISRCSFSKLKVGHFIVQYDISNPHKIKAPKFLLGNKHAMKNRKREQILAEQRQKRYAPPYHYKMQSSFKEQLVEEGYSDHKKSLIPKRKFRSQLYQ